MILITLKNELNVYRAVHIGKLFGMSPNKKIFTSLKNLKAISSNLNYKNWLISFNKIRHVMKDV